jgi:hypothetical protein
MIDRRLKVLLILLGGSIAIAACAITLSFGLDRLAEARANVDRYEDRIARLRRAAVESSGAPESIDSLQREIADLRARFYGSDDMNPYLFGTIVKQKLAARGMEVSRYQVIDIQGSTVIEFSVSGSIRSFLGFLRDVSQADKVWNMPFMTCGIREGTERVDAVFRIRYAVIDA